MYLGQASEMKVPQEGQSFLVLHVQAIDQFLCSDLTIRQGEVTYSSLVCYIILSRISFIQSGRVSAEITTVIWPGILSLQICLLACTFVHLL